MVAVVKENLLLTKVAPRRNCPGLTMNPLKPYMSCVLSKVEMVLLLSSARGANELY